MKRIVLIIFCFGMICAASFFWFEKCYGDYCVSRSTRNRGADRVAILESGKTLECDYLATCIIWNDAIAGKDMDEKTRAYLAIQAYRATKDMFDVIPGYRKVIENMNKMRMIVKETAQ